ncbi:acyl-CoA reductase-like NAD-dependent aldehyde dehydrogenase [Geomicrobium halophilum]|uniref:Acyl-CoA reductase-like NAD-dependent aldehyde dehydrogenase n=1 Tax=Geomicrobium halophilum TaxID=549000 RepID=A0A841PNA4_9BACL|nr:aldehyde dehydrogenase family protein [Geomicrobium halophilum]MBB6448686.1 acyl-CoA reductase-like NAD-dependent aldehyde dehydrogenase [Geomicrobium halophilum]
MTIQTSNKQGNLVNGEWIKSEETFLVENKYTHEPFAHVAKANKQLIDKAVTSAYDTFQNVKLTATDRHHILIRSAELFKERKDEIAMIICREAGKTINDAKAEVDRGIQTFIASAEEAKQISGQGLPIHGQPGNDEKMAFSIRVPVGVICAITPFNFPFNLTAHKVAPAIAAGNTIVLKPAERTPVTAIKIAEIMLKAGLPSGYINVVNGFGKETGPMLLKDKRIAMFTFTGSPNVGREIKNNSGIRKVTLELGSNSPNIIHHDTLDLKRAVQLVISRGYSNSGQACISVQRIYVHRSIYHEVIEEATKLAESFTVGNPELETTNIGPMISIDEAERAENWVKEALEEGAHIATGGQREGALFYPTILTNVTENMKVMCEEVFAPVISIVPYDEIDEVFKRVNDSRFGLQAGLFTSNFHIAMKAAQKLEFGGVNINDVSTFRADILPYGGIKDSGIGKEGPRSAIEEMTNEKVITMHL